jgi:DNA-binding transcriptional ArsR family regulator
VKAATKKHRKSATRKRAKSIPVKLGHKQGCEVELRIRERSGKIRDTVERAVTYPALALGSKSRSTRQTPSNRPPARLPDASTEAFAAIGHPQRARMLLALLAGPATYGSIQKTTKLKAGPLYHHINQLRLAGLIAPKQRDLYELTRGGRNLALLAIAAAPLIKDSRRRPLGS